MSTLLVSRITTESNTTYLTLTTGNTLSGSIVIQTSNSDITINGTLKGDGAKLANVQSDVANAAYTIANAAFGAANSGATYNYVNTSVTAANTWANTVGGSSNAYANVVGAAANTWANTKLANGTVVLAGGLTTTNGIADSKGDLRNIPVNDQSASYVLTLADNGKVISLTTGNVFVTASIFFPGNTISVFNNSAANLTITQNTSVTLYSAGTANTGNRILQQRGIATILCVAANTFVVTGAGMVP